MALKSSTYPVKVAKSKTAAKKQGLLSRHQLAMEKVLAEAKSFSDDRQRALKRIKDKNLRESAAR